METIKIDLQSPPGWRNSRLWIQPGGWFQVEIRAEDGTTRARRILVTESDFLVQLCALLKELAEPERLPVWERGELISGCASP